VDLLQIKDVRKLLYACVKGILLELQIFGVGISGLQQKKGFCHVLCIGIFWF